jgi:hypothetical protein
VHRLIRWSSARILRAIRGCDVTCLQPDPPAGTVKQDAKKRDIFFSSFAVIRCQQRFTQQPHIHPLSPIQFSTQHETVRRNSQAETCAQRETIVIANAGLCSWCGVGRHETRAQVSGVQVTFHPSASPIGPSPRSNPCALSVASEKTNTPCGGERVGARAKDQNEIRTQGGHGQASRRARRV